MWAQLRADLQRRLAAGAFTSAFPGELALVSEYGVSRHTVRTALRELRADGIVVAERGRRPRLAGPATITQPLGALYSLFAWVESAGLRQASIVRARDLCADGVIADRLGLEASTPLFHLERLRLAGGEPLALDTVWLPAEIAAPLLEADFTHTALYDELAARTGIRLEGGREHIRAVVPTRAQQRLLGIPHSTGVLAIDRLGYAGGRPVEWRHTLIRGRPVLPDRRVLSAHRLPAHPRRAPGHQRGGQLPRSGLIAATAAARGIPGWPGRYPPSCGQGLRPAGSGPSRVIACAAIDTPVMATVISSRCQSREPPVPGVDRRSEPGPRLRPG